MGNHSWSNPKLPGTIVTQFNERSPGALCRGICYRRQEHNFDAAPLSENFYVIGRAYNEPQAGSCIEDLLLQRNFIID